MFNAATEIVQDIYGGGVSNELTTSQKTNRMSESISEQK